MSDHQLWRPEPRTPAAEAVHQAAEADRRERPERYLLDPDVLLAAALRGQPPEALGEGDWRAALDRLTESMRLDARLNAVGTAMAAGTVIGRLRARLSIREWQDTHRDHEADAPTPGGPVLPPIVIIGGWRTGTTFLQRLLATVPGLRALRPHELSAPWKVAGAGPEERARLAAGAAAAHDRLHLLNPAMQVVHASGADLPEECVLALGTSLRNWGFTSTMRLDGYVRWLTEQSFAGEYRAYAEVLGMLDDCDGRRFVLKAPAHTAELAHLLAALPGVIVVHLHRDVVQTVASGASLFAVFRSTYSDEVDPVEVGAAQLRTTTLWFDRAMDVRESLAPADEARVVDVAYPDLVADPAGTARRVCEAAGVAWDVGTETAVRSHLQRAAAQPAVHAGHRYHAAQFGLDEDHVRATLARYRTRFGVG